MGGAVHARRLDSARSSPRPAIAWPLCRLQRLPEPGRLRRPTGLTLPAARFRIAGGRRGPRRGGGRRRTRYGAPPHRSLDPGRNPHAAASGRGAGAAARPAAATLGIGAIGCAVRHPATGRMGQDHRHGAADAGAPLPGGNRHDGRCMAPARPLDAGAGNAGRRRAGHHRGLGPGLRQRQRVHRHVQTRIGCDAGPLPQPGNLPRRRLRIPRPPSYAAGAYGWWSCWPSCWPSCGRAWRPPHRWFQPAAQRPSRPWPWPWPSWWRCGRG